jgi:hypothetical protein
MKGKTITVQEYAKLYGCTARRVQQSLANNTGLTGMIGWRKAGNTWLITVLMSWYESHLN